MDRGQLHPGPAGHFHVIEADHPHIPRHRQAGIAQGADRTQGQHVIAAEPGLSLAACGKLGLHGGASCVEGIGLSKADGSPGAGMQGRLGQKTCHAVLRGAGRFRAAQKAKPRIAPPDQRLGRHPAAGDVVDAHDMHIGCAVRPPEGVDHGHPRLAEGAGKAAGQGRGGDDDPIHRILPQHLHRPRGVGFVGQVDQQRAQTPVLQAAGEQIEDLQEDRVAEVVRHQSDQPRAACGQAACQKIRGIAQVGCRAFHLGARPGRNRRAFGKAARHGRA